MIEIESRLAEEAKGWIDEQARTLSTHPDPAAWERYRAGDLPEAEIERLRDHLVSCRSCRKLVLAGRQAGSTVSTIVAEPDATRMADAEQRRAWHGLREQLDEMTALAAVPPKLPRPAKWVSWASTVAAVVSFTVAGWTWHQAHRPELGLVIAEAVPLGSSRGAPAAGIGPEEARDVALLISAPELQAGTPVRVEILDGAGHVAWTGTGPASVDGEYGMKLPARFQGSEGCQVRLSMRSGGADGSGEWQTLGTYVVNAPSRGAGEAAAP